LFSIEKKIKFTREQKMFLFNKSAFSTFTLMLVLSACGGSGSVNRGDGVTTWVGTKQLGVVGFITEGWSVVTDANGNVYVAGITDGSLDGNTLTGVTDLFVTKYDSSGVKQYTKQLGVAESYTYGTSVTTDDNDNVFVAGITDGGLDGNTLIGTSDFFVTKYDSTGVKQYTKQLGVVGSNTEGTSVTTDANENVYVAGTTYGGLDNNILTGITDFFLTKYNNSGIKQYTRQLGVVGSNTDATSVTTDANGSVYVAGITDGGLDGNTLTGTSDFFVTKYDSTGVKQYTKQLGVMGSITRGWSVTTDAYGNVYLAGSTTGGLDGNMVTGTRDSFVTKYDSAGVKQYTKQLGVVGFQSGFYSVATDTNENVYLAGDTKGGMDGNTLTGISDFFVTKYDSAGTKQYTKQLGVLGFETYNYSLATDANDNVFVAGITYGGLDGNTLMGIRDSFVTKYDSSGVKQ
jgi:hypothetical protein